jgi:hypothetical protein
MRLALLRAPLPGWRMALAHRLGAALDHSPYSHGELVFSDRVTGSSWLRGGVQLRTMPDGHYDRARWDFFTIPDAAREQRAREWFEANQHLPYDVWGPVRFGVGFVPQDARGMYCHEAIAASLGLSEPWRYTGGLLLALARDHWNTMRVLGPWYTPPPWGELGAPNA